VAVNRQIEGLLGRQRQELIGQPVLQLHPEGLREGLAAAFARRASMPAGNGGDNILSDILHRDGGRIPVEISVSIVDLPDGRRLLLGMFRDIRERVRLQERLTQAEKLTAIGQLAGGVAHDFNNQLAGIAGFAELLVARLQDPRQRGWAEAILGSAQRAAELTRQLLAFARKGQSLRSPTDIDRTIAEVIGLLRRSLDQRIAIVHRPAGAACTVLGDPGQIHNALLNLAVNARDAMPEGGTLTFATRIAEPPGGLAGQDATAGRQVEITVADTGQGMDEEVRRHLFEPFFTTKGPGKGTGLGLAAVYGVVRNHGGAIAVDSHPGRGTAFTILLPLHDGACADPAPAPEQPPVPAAGRSILVIDDEEVVRELTCEMLAELGCRCRHCADAESAIALLAAGEPVDLAVLDVVMPRLAGLDAFLALRAARPGLRVLLVSGHSLNGEVQAILDRGACGFLQKPFRATALARAVHDALAGPGHGSGPRPG